MKRKYKVGLHVLVWLIVFLNDVLPKYLNNTYRSFAEKSGSSRLLFDYLMVNLGYLIYGIVVFYTAAYIIAPSFLKYRKWTKGIIALILLFIFIPAYRYVIEFYIFLPYLGFDNYFGKVPAMDWYIKNSITYMFYGYFIYGIIYFIIIDRYNTFKKHRELEQEKIIAELAFLKSQINPHFLFNTLNDIYALTYHKSDDAPHAVLKLADLLRYMLKESDEKFCPLKNEIDYLKNVIELHQIGQKGVSYVNFTIEGPIGNHEIAPLILINFVENAFKHGIFNAPDCPITIKININQDFLLFRVHNKISNDVKDQTGGIGLSNVKRRLELIYAHRHSLQITTDKNDFTVELQIKWK